MGVLLKLPKQSFKIVQKYVKKILRSDFVAAYTFLLPATLILLTFKIYPAIRLFWLSFRDKLLIRPSSQYIAFANFSRLLTDTRFWNALGNTTVFVAISVPLQTGLALLIALGLKRKVKGLAFFRAGYFAPVVVSMVSVAVVWQWIYHPDLGLFNFILTSFGLSPVEWLHESGSFITPIWNMIVPLIESVGLNPEYFEFLNVSTAMFAIILMAVWKGTGYYMVIYLAGLMDIPQIMYESAEIDGANGWQKFKNVTWPLLAPTTYLVLVLQMINSFKVFSSVYVMTNGGPSRKTETMVFYIYQRAFQGMELSYASAIALVLFIILLTLTLLNKVFVGGRISYER